MKKILLLSILALSLMLLNGCGKKEKVQKTDSSDPNKTTTTEYVEFKCNNMHCSGCEETITNAVKKLDGIKEVSADAKSKIVKVTFLKEATNKGEIEKSINAAGYDTETSKSENKHNCDME